MMPDSFWKKELLEDLSNRKALALKFLIPVILLFPVILIPQVPLQVKATALPGALLFVGVFGSAIGLLKMRESGMGERLASLPLSRRSIVLQYVLANTLSDAVQLALPFIALVLISGTQISIPLLLLSYASALVAANSLGALVASLSTSAGEGHLFSILAVMAMAALSGIIPAGGIFESMSAFSPIHSLYLVLIGTVPALQLILPLFSSLLLLALPLVFSRRIFMRGGS
jgi:hypothetical protein